MRKVVPLFLGLRAIVGPRIADLTSLARVVNNL